jgi:hypothetical protein
MSVMVDKWVNSLDDLLVPSQHPIDLEHDHMDGIWSGNVWAWFRSPLLRLRERLKSLQLPLNWHSSMGSRAQPMASLRHYPCLEVLVLPRVAIIANPYGEGYVPEIHQLQAIEFLPRSIKKLVISNVDVETCAWVQAAFQHKWIFPHLREVELVFPDNFQPVLSYGFESDAKQAGVKVIARWNGMQKEL